MNSLVGIIDQYKEQRWSEVDGVVRAAKLRDETNERLNEAFGIATRRGLHLVRGLDQYKHTFIFDRNVGRQVKHFGEYVSTQDVKRWVADEYPDGVFFDGELMFDRQEWYRMGSGKNWHLTAWRYDR